MNNSLPQFIPMLPNNGKGSSIIVYVDSSPYPEVTGNNDPEAVELLKEDYAGAQGELTAITQYIYQNSRDSANQSFANSLLQIAIVEMMHLDMLGDAIVTLGGSPSFDNGKYYWGANYVNYSLSMEEMINADITAEKNTIANYEKHIAQIKNESVKALLRRIVKDEELHLRFFNDQLNSCKQSNR